ncbi:MAG: 3-dehydroquinate synthase [Pseudomonadales bacterium]|jgi:3-dehydroquinate synthase|nr:3-dehydroquinate synthase [Pseudomonadales bacterium]
MSNTAGSTDTTSLNVESLTVSLGERSYPIFVGDVGFSDPAKLAEGLAPYLKGNQVAIITNETIAPLYLQQVQSALGNRQVDVFQMPDGESYKSLDTYTQVMDFLLEKKHNRSTCLIALGGGVVGDLCGFVAATFQRGVDFIQIPTTLLSQVDSSVGGKTAVNHPAGKNMIGAFYQPLAVFADISVLETLPDREYAAGLAEVVKYGIIYDADFFAWLEANAPALVQREKYALTHIITRSCEVKAAVVSEDEREGGRRAILNYGHTFGHAIEKLLGYGRLLHGEAVSIGMVMAARLSVEFSGLALADSQRIEKLLQQLNLPVTLKGLELNAEAMIDAMGMDKKVVDGELRFVVADQMGSVRVASHVSVSALEKTLAEFC